MPMDTNTFRKRAAKAFEGLVEELVQMLGDEDEDEDEDDSDAGNGSRGRGDEKPKPSAAATAAQVRKLRAACKKRGLLEDFEALEETGASVEKLQDLLLSGVRTSGADINGGRGVEDGKESGKGQLRSGRESAKVRLAK